MSEIKNHLNESMYYTLSECPLRFWGALQDVPQNKIQRMTIYVEDKPMMIWDIYLTPETRFEANLDVDPAFRNSNWMDLLTQSDPGSLETFSRPKAVWCTSGPIIIEQETALTNFHKTMTERNIMRTGKIYSEGFLNKIIHISDWP